ncbi:MAG: GNAT family N-acetyltransferase [Planctomycetota bacterium]|jgi:GNAT superfamily N-acetyltransferase
MEICEPATENDWQQYYQLRESVLAPLHDHSGTLKDDLEEDSYHLMAAEGNICIGIGRVHFNHSAEGQIRYMAVDPDWRGRGVGLAIMEALEIYLLRNATAVVVLNAHRDAVGFYEKHGYKTIENVDADVCVKMCKQLMR